MDGIPGELIFVLIFIAFSVLEGIGRKRNAQRKRGQVQKPSPGSAQGGRREGIPPAKEPKASGSSEDLIPQDIWEEILGLARGTSSRTPTSKAEGREDTDMGGRPLPPSEAETLEEIPPFEARTLEPVEPRPEVDRGLPDPAGTPAGSGERGERRPSRQMARKKPALAATEIGTGPGMKAPPRRKARGNRIRQGLFGDGSPEDLRKAVILREVLGKPVGMRD